MIQDYTVQDIPLESRYQIKNKERKIYVVWCYVCLYEEETLVELSDKVY